ncbi:hypothetical protein PEG85_13185 [Lactococcus cremoris]|uniref:hypothetical protein n=1 Tax=Lactococcus lactis subsp. cremoris TaxID=1359 RepID=UPI0022E637D0|nr:hypothetical protein [Lactococcus cremoris]MDA2881892.1 hypothetical protein [Lactococcus cremoris]MDA2884385.1 hypothetical protein [Lactococcus cremoris]
MFRKKNYRFEISTTAKIVAPEVNNTPDLINYVIEENQRLLEVDDFEQLIIRKFVEKNNQENILYAQLLDLPMPEDTNFDELLVSFYSKKPVSYDSDLNDDKFLVSEKKENINNINTSDDEGYAKAPIIDEIDIEESEVPNSQINNEQGIESQVSAPLKGEEITEMAIKKIVAEEIKAKDDEIDSLRRQLKQKDIVGNPGMQELHASSDIIAPTLSNSIITDAVTPTVNYKHDGETVSDIITVVKHGFEDSLKEFVATETQKINAEIEALDNRDKISPELTHRSNIEKNAAIQALSEDIKEKIAISVSAENARHEEALKKIEIDFESQRAAKVEDLENQYQSQLQDDISKEYQLQTEQLNRILQGKTDEMLLHQKEVNDGMKQAVSDVLSSFNADHNQVIQEVERRKKSSSLIPLHKQVG